MNSRKIYNGKITQIIDHTPHTREIWIEQQSSQDIMNFKAGQFLMLHVPAKELNKPVMRAYSIASSEYTSKQLRLIFKYVPNGIASTFIWSLKGEENVQFTGPFGRVFFKEPVPHQVVFMCTGSGVAQHLSFLEYIKKNNLNIKTILLFGLHDEREIYLLNELDRIKNDLVNFNYKLVLSSPNHNWTGLSGYIQQHLEDVDYLNQLTYFYLCGNNNMIKQTKQLLVEKNGFDSRNIFCESFD